MYVTIKVKENDISVKRSIRMLVLLCYKKLLLNVNLSNILNIDILFLQNIIIKHIY